MHAVTMSLRFGLLGSFGHFGNPSFAGIRADGVDFTPVFYGDQT